jgi:uncharacterized surface protein with fasciclin (FAS1) repeats
MIRKMTAGLLLATLAIAALAPVSASAAPTKDIVQKAIAVNGATGDFDTVLTAATCDYLGSTVTDILSSPDKTLFAPTDKAFRQLGLALGLPKGLNPGNVCKVDSLLGDGTLLTILGYHVIDAKVAYRDAVKASGAKVQMLLGGKARISGNAQHLRIDGADIIAKNVRATNGFIHVVNKVLTPPALG